MLFRKEKHAQNEIYNDINSDLVNLFRCVKYHENELQKELDFMINSRELFDNYLSQMNITGLTDIQRAARYFYLIKLSYGSTITTYGATKKDTEKMKNYLTKIQKRLSKVVVENKSFEDIIKKYDKENTLFYLDPPYHGTELYYNTNFTEEEHLLLNKILKNIKGKFVLSYNDDEYIRKLYKNFKTSEVERNNNLTSRYKDNKRYKELIIKNF